MTAHPILKWIAGGVLALLLTTAATLQLIATHPAANDEAATSTQTVDGFAPAIPIPVQSPSSTNPLSSTSTRTTNFNSDAIVWTSVSNDGAITVRADSEGALQFFDSNGVLLKGLTKTELPSELSDPSELNPLLWLNHELWAEASEPNCTNGFLEINANTFEVKYFDISICNGPGETALNPAARKIAFSTEPFNYDADAETAFRQSATLVELRVYDLYSGAMRRIATSSAKSFRPRWLDANTLEYNNPSGAGRTSVTVASDSTTSGESGTH